MTPENKIPAKEFLDQLGKVPKLIKRLQSLLNSPVVNPSITPTASAKVNIRGFQEEINARLEHLNAISKAFYKMVQQIPDPDQQSVMIHRYYNASGLAPWNVVAEQLNFSNQWVYEIHSRAMNTFEQIYERSQPA